MTDKPIFDADTDPLDRVREGMTVVDDGGRDLGKVVSLRLGDPGAVSMTGNEPRGGDLVEADPPFLDDQAFMMGTPPVYAGEHHALRDVPVSVREHLLRGGFIEVDGHGLDGAERLIPSDRIREVSEDVVTVRRSAAGRA
jgi:hypothetical protein